MKSRILVLFSLFLFLWALLLARGAVLQIFPNPKLASLQKRQFETKIEVNGRRGLIVDRQGRELAASVPSTSLYADPQILEQPRATGRRLAKILNMPYKGIYGKLKNRKRRFVWIKRHLTDAESKKIRAWDVRGLGLIDEPKRVYPNHLLLSKTLGRVGIDGHGLEGLELQYENILRGEQRQVVLPRDARGRPLLKDGGLITSVQDGKTLELTVDAELQFIVEKELSRAMGQFAADAATGIVLDPVTGEILALASTHAGPSSIRNRVVTDAFEPGSTMKTFVVAASLREGVAQPNTKFFCENGRFQVGDRWIKEADKEHEFGWLTVSEILAFSSNIGVAKMAIALGPDRLRKAMADFGFGQKLDLDFPGEGQGVLQNLPWRPHLLANISFGHGISTTAIQMASAYAAIANGGLLKRPYIVRHQNRELDIRRVLSKEQASTMRLLLRAATMEHATGEKARIPGFPVAGKTGTAQKVDLESGGYIRGAYIASFAGFVPANDPRFVIYVAIDNPKKQYYASQVAAPVFARIAQFAVRQAQLTPILLSENNIIASPTTTVDKIKALRHIAENQSGLIPELKGLTLREVLRRTRSVGLEPELIGRGRVASTYPAAGSPAPDDKKVRVFFESNP